jgi:F-type H+-transporting ATPase subunit b
MRIDWWTLGLQTINLLVLLWLLGKFLFRPMVQIVAARQDAADQMLNAAKAAREEADAALKEIEAEREQAAEARDKLLASARTDAEAKREELIEAARAEAQQQYSDALAALDRARDEAEARLGRQANVLATDIAARLLERPGAHLLPDAFLPELESALAALPETTRAAIATYAEPAILASARPLDEKTQAAAQAAIGRALGRDATLSFALDPTLIAGLRLSSGVVVLDANLRADLDRVRARLDSNDE